MSYAYDPAGALAIMIDPSGTTAYGYDAAGRITSVATAAGTVTYTYRTDGRRATMTSPHSTVAYSYDAVGRLSTLTDTLAGTVTFTHTFGGVGTISRPNGIVTTNAYDFGGRLTRIDHAGPGGLIDFFDYTLDPNGNPTEVTSNDGTESYTLDDLDRLVAATYPNGDTETFAYSAAGDRTRATINGAITDYTYDPAGRLQSTSGPGGTVGFSWDDNGNLASTTAGDSYTWTSQNLMKTASVGAAHQSYEYDASGVRIAVDGDRWLWDRLNGMPQLLDDGSSRFLPGAATTTAGGTTWQLADGLGTTRHVTDASGATTASSDYSVFGSVRSSTGTNGALGFTGQYTDDTGQVHLRARQYDPALGLFLSPDSVQPNAGGSQGYGLYGYAAGCPTANSDPTGRFVLAEYATKASQSTNQASILAQVVTGQPMDADQARRLCQANKWLAIAGGTAGAIGLFSPTAGALSLGIALVGAMLSGATTGFSTGTYLALGAVVAGALSIRHFPRAAGLLGIGVSIYFYATAGDC